MYQNFFIHSSVDGHLGCFRVLAIVNSAAVNIVVQVMLFSGYMQSGAFLMIPGNRVTNTFVKSGFLGTW